MVRVIILKMLFFYFPRYTWFLLVEINDAYKSLPNKAVGNKCQVIKFIKNLKLEMNDGKDSDMWERKKYSRQREQNEQ